jgi:hypothetical protein
MAKKEVIYQGLSDLNVLIDDTTQYSPDYFRITNLPGEFTAGINIFKFKGNPSLFPENSPIYIEVLDANGFPIYYEIGLDLESQEQSAIISVYINEDTVPGNGSVTICGQANQSSSGQILDPSEINVRWSVPVYIDISKRNTDEIIFNAVPIATVTSNDSQVSEIEYLDITSSDINPTLRNKSQVQTAFVLNNSSGQPAATYYYNNDTPVLILNNDDGAFSWNIPQRGFVTSSIDAVIKISSSFIKDLVPNTSSLDIITQQVSSSVESFTGSAIFKASSIAAGTGSHIAFLQEPISFAINNSNDRYYPESATISLLHITYTLSKTPDNIYTFENKTQNTYNSVDVNFSNLTPLVGTIAKIRSYYKSSGVGEYILLNETDITQYDTEFGFNTGSLLTTFALPTVHKGEKIDFKFEYISPTGFVSKQYTEVKNTTFAGGNTYIGGDDNLITGSLFVASSTGSGVQISGKNNAAMIRSIGYEGFAKASLPGGNGGFVIYSGSVQPLLNASENYSGVGIELFANTSSYFKYTTSGSGLLDIRTETFFLGGQSQFISGSNGNIIISSSNFSINQEGNTAMSGDVNAVNGIFENVNIIGQIPSSSISSSMSKPWLLESWVTSSSDRFNIKFVSTASAGNFQSGKPFSFTAGGTFKTGMLQWTASIESGSKYTYTGSLDAKAYDPFPITTTSVRDFPDLAVLEPYTSASIHVSYTFPYSTSFTSMLNYGFTGSAYTGGDKFDVKPTAPIGFSKWAEIHGTYNINSYNGIGMETTSSTSHSLVNNPFYPNIGTVDTVVFPAPRVSYIPSAGVYNPTTGLPTRFGTGSRNAGRVQTNEFTYEGAYAFCITSEVITLDTSLLGLDEYGKLVNEPLGIQFAAKYCALDTYTKTWVTYGSPLGKYKGDGSGFIDGGYTSRRPAGTYKPIGATWPEYWKRDIRCDIIGIDPILGIERLLISQNQSTAGTINWSMFNIPLSLVLTTDTEDDVGSQVIYNKFRIKLSWRKGWRSDLEDDKTSGLIRFSEIRIVNYPSSEGLHVPSLQLEDSAFLSDKESTQHFGNFKPSAIDSYDLGSDLLSWKDIYSSGVIQMSNKFDQIKIGNKAGYDNFGENSTFIGTFAGESSYANDNAVLLGHEAGRYASNTTSNVVFVGESAGRYASDASGSVFIGTKAGDSSKFQLSYSDRSVAIGAEAGREAFVAPQSVMIGNSTGFSASFANNSVMIGSKAGYFAQTAQYSILLGYRSGYAITTADSVGVNNIIIGNNISLPSSTTNSLNIGGVLFGTGLYDDSSNNFETNPPLTGSVANGRIGINKVLPTATLDVSGSAIITGSLTVTNGITGSLFGTASWATNAISTPNAFTLGGSPFVGYVPYANGNLTFTNSGIYYSSTNIGIGTTSIQGKFHVHQSTNLGGTTGNNLILQTLQNTGGSGGNLVYIKDYAVRDATGTDWTTWRHHNSIDIDGVYNTPGTNTRTFWERDPNAGVHYFGNSTTTTLTVDAGNNSVGVGGATESGVALMATVNNNAFGSTAILNNTNSGTSALAQLQFRTATQPSTPFVIHQFNNGATVQLTNVANASVAIGTNNTTRVTITNGGAMGLGVTPTNTLGRFEASNDIVAYSSSDKNWKTNIKNINSPLEKISQINGVEFDWIEDEPVHGNKGHDVGVIAQEIEQILPEIVQTRESGMKAVQYDKMIPLLVECIKDQQKQIEELKQIINGITK